MIQCFYASGKWQKSDQTQSVFCSASQEKVGDVYFANERQILEAISFADHAFQSFRYTPHFELISILSELKDLIKHHQDHFVDLISA